MAASRFGGTLEILLIYLAAGAVAGLASGLFGIGGGLIIVPVLLFVFAGQGVVPELQMHMAVGTSLATIIVTSLSSIRAHYRLGGILWPVFRQLAAGIILGTLIGAVVADALSRGALEMVFAVLVLVLAAKMAFGGQPAPHRSLPGVAGLLGAGSVIGSISALMGIGGGALSVTYLSWCGVEMRKAVGTSAACGLPIAVSGAASFIVTGWNEAQLPPGATGYVYWPAAGGIVAASVLLAPLGARLAHRLPQKALKRAFAVFLAVVGLKLLLT